MSFGEYFQAFGSLGDGFRASRKEAEQKAALSKLGDLVQSGDYTGAARVAFNAGDASTGFNLVKMGQAIAQQKLNASSLDGLIGGLYGTQGAPAVAGVSVDASGPSTPRLPTFADASGAGGDYLSNLFKRESGNNPNARPSTSGAAGLGQFIPSTWNATARAHPELGLTPITPGMPDPRKDERQMVAATKALTADNEAVLADKGLPVTDASRYALHFLGAGAGPKLVAGALSNPNAPATAFAGAAAVAANRPVFFNRDGSPKTAGQVMNDFQRSFGGGRSQVAQAPVAVPTFGARSIDTADAGPAMQMPGVISNPPLPPQRPVQMASAEPDAVPIPSAMPAPPAPVAPVRPMQLPQAAPSMVGQPPPAEIGVGSNILNAPMQANGAAPMAVPPAPRPPQVLVPQSMAGAGIPGTVMDRGNPVAQVGAQAAPAQAAPAQADDGEDSPATAAAVPPQVRAQVSAQAPAHLAQAGIPAPIATGIAAAPPASQARIQALLRASMLPGLSEGQSKVVSTLLTNELEQTKLPDTVKQFLFAKTPAGGGFDGTYAEFVNKSKDEGAKITAQIEARTKYAQSQGWDLKSPGVQAWVIGSGATSNRVVRQGDMVVGPTGVVVAKNDGGATGGGMSDEQAAYTADRVIAGDTKALIGLDKGTRGRITALAAQRALERGIDPSDILHNAAVASGLGAQERSLGTSAGRMSAAAAEAEQAANFALQASDKVARTQFVPVNKVLQMIQTNTGDPAIREFNAANNTLVNTYARAVSPTGAATVADKQHAYDLLNTANTKEQYAAVVDLLQREIRAAHKAPQQARDTLEAERQAAKRGGQGGGNPPGTVPNPMQPDGGAARDNAPKFQAPPPQAINDARAKIREGYSVEQIKDAMRRKGFEPPPDL
jgi:hypothetical protein